MRHYWKVSRTDVIPVSTATLRDALEPLISHIEELNYFADIPTEKLDEAVERAYMRATEHLNNIGIIGCGDYVIVISDSIPKGRMEKGGFTSELFGYIAGM